MLTFFACRSFYRPCTGAEAHTIPTPCCVPPPDTQVVLPYHVLPTTATCGWPCVYNFDTFWLWFVGFAPPRDRSA